MTSKPKFYVGQLVRWSKKPDLTLKVTKVNERQAHRVPTYVTATKYNEEYIIYETELEAMPN